MANSLYLRLEGAMQSWGERGRWSIRDSAPQPTKSGVLGLVGCAMGVGDDETLRMLHDNTQLAVRIDRAGTRMTDYHTIGGGYAEPMLLTAQGKPKKTPKGAPHTELSFRDYLCDAAFVAALWSEDEALIDRMARAVQAPVWPFFLGRKSCPPATPVFMATDTHSTLEEAIRHAPATDYMQTDADGKLRAVVESSTGTGTMQRDQLISRRYRQYAARYTDELLVPAPVEEAT